MSSVSHNPGGHGYAANANGNLDNEFTEFVRRVPAEDPSLKNTVLGGPPIDALRQHGGHGLSYAPPQQQQFVPQTNMVYGQYPAPYMLAPTEGLNSYAVENYGTAWSNGSQDLEAQFMSQNGQAPYGQGSYAPQGQFVQQGLYAPPGSLYGQPTQFFGQMGAMGYNPIEMEPQMFNGIDYSQMHPDQVNSLQDGAWIQQQQEMAAMYGRQSVWISQQLANANGGQPAPLFQQQSSQPDPAQFFPPSATAGPSLPVRLAPATTQPSPVPAVAPGLVVPVPLLATSVTAPESLVPPPRPSGNPGPRGDEIDRLMVAASAVRPAPANETVLQQPSKTHTVAPVEIPAAGLTAALITLKIDPVSVPETRPKPTKPASWASVASKPKVEEPPRPVMLPQSAPAVAAKIAFQPVPASTVPPSTVHRAATAADKVASGGGPANGGRQQKRPDAIAGKGPAPPAAPAGGAKQLLPENLSKLLAHKDWNYNPVNFPMPASARFFIIKSYSEDDVHKSIKFNVWTSTKHGNDRLNRAFLESSTKGPIYLLFSVNGSGHFCGVAQMISEVDFNKCSGVWEEDKWKSEFNVKWIFVKDVPNREFRHIRVESNENKPVTNSRDAQEVPFEHGRQVLKIISNFSSQTSLFNDFAHYEKRAAELEKTKKEQAALLAAAAAAERA